MLLSLSALVLGLSASPLVHSLPLTAREVPQEHSHEQFLTSVRTSLQSNNPLQIVDPVFGLLGNAAAAGGAGQVSDPDCLQQATADQAFTNAKSAGDVQGMVSALIYRALERNTGSVGLASPPCTSLQATNPEIAAISQHQDPASPNAAATNKGITLSLARQIASVGGDPLEALKSGTFAPGTVGDPTGKGNTCDDAGDAVGCIITQNLLVEDATPDEIQAAVAGMGGNSTDATSTSAGSAADAAGSGTCPPAAVTTSASAAAATSTAASSSSSSSSTSSTSTSASSNGTNLQTFTGALGGITPPPVLAGGKGFITDNSEFLNLAAALGRSCDVQHNQCANAANAQHQAGFSVADCDNQDTQCKAAASSSSVSSASSAAATAASVASTTTTTTTTTQASAASATNDAVSTSSSSGANLQTFTGALGGIAPPPVLAGGKGFVTDNSEFVNLAAALGRSCDVQHNQCANAANAQHQAGFSVGDCDAQDTQCKAAAGA